ncbi:DUF397 domain-containing protein [Actinosynnema sp. NPDC059335]|uniref:DUF397 domain-containing protein n=1 Tax=Actinosynnema sp. NPDC059335 TaxID=3346804 RepID=UPI00366EFC64
MVWRKSSNSGPQQGDCVELAHMTGLAFVRNSRNRNGPHLAFPLDRWQTFLSAVKTGPLGQHPR